MSKVTATREWTTDTGKHVVASVSLVLSKTINADGDVITVDCCEMSPVTATVTGCPEQWSYSRLTAPRVINGKTYIATIGKLGLTAETDALVRDMIAEINAHPAWVAKETRANHNQREITEMHAASARNGLCPKCGTYCHGDCEAN